MSAECTEYDVRVTLYDTTKQKMAIVSFFNDTEVLLECDRVKVVRNDDKIYFHKGDGKTGSIKVSGRKHNMLQLCADYSMFEDMEGTYDLKYDAPRNIYYISKSEKLSDYEHGYSVKGCKHLNYNSGVREKGVYKREKVDIAVPVAQQKKIHVETPEDKKPVMLKMIQGQTKVRATDPIVVKALLELLKSQVADNKDALSTIQTLEGYIKL